MLYTSGTTGQSQGRGAEQPQYHRDLEEHRLNSINLRPDDAILAYLPMAWVGDFIFSVGQAYVDGVLRQLSRKARTR